MARTGWLTIDRNASDHQGGDHVIALVLAKNENPTASGRNRDVVHGGNPQLAAIGQMDREGHKRSDVRKFANIDFHRLTEFTAPSISRQGCGAVVAVAVPFSTETLECRASPGYLWAMKPGFR
jgi:hypothetical protein